MSEEREERCELCRFWEELPYGHQDEVEKKHGHLNGTCRRYPPQMNTALIAQNKEEFSDDETEYLNLGWSFPVTDSLDDWCGEFQPKGAK